MQALVNNDERSTNLIFRSLKNTARVAKNSVSDEVVRRLAVPGAKFEDVQPLVAGVKGAVVLDTGDMEAGIYWASMAQGLIHDVPTCKELIDRMIADADAIVQKRLPGFSR